MTVALLARSRSTRRTSSAFAHATVTAQVDGGGTLAAPSDAIIAQVDVRATSPNSHMQNANGAILNVVGRQRPDGDRPGSTTRQLLRQRPRRRLDRRRAVADDPRRGRRLRGRRHAARPAAACCRSADSSATSQGSPHVSASVGGNGSVILTQGDINGQALGLTDSDASSSSTRSAIAPPDRQLHRDGDDEPERHRSRSTPASSITSNSGHDHVRRDARRRRRRPRSDGTFDAARRSTRATAAAATRSRSPPRTTSRPAT